MDFSAIAHHAYDTFCYPINQDELKITIQTAKDIDSVSLVWGDPFMAECADGKNWTWKREAIPLLDRKETQAHFLWSAVVKPPFKRCKYYFEVKSGEERKFFFEDGLFDSKDFKSDESILDEHVLFIFPWINSCDVCSHPSWAERTVWYQIFPARFCHGENPADPHTLLPWGKPGHTVKNNERYGGNLRGIIDKLDYLQDLGITGLYLNPVNLSHSQHKYDTTDYLQIDPEFGTREDMTELVQKAHAHGMRVMLDGVFNHSGWDFFAWQDVLKNRENSEYASWYIINDFNFADHPTDAAANGKFFSFALTDSMPKLNTNNPQVRSYIIDVCTHWVKEYDIDALRLDVANEISHQLCTELHYAMRALKDDFFIVGEIWNHAMPWLRGNQFDSVINYPLRNAILGFALDKTLTAKSLEHQINQCLTMYYEQTEKVLLNQLDSHDTPRLVTKSQSRDSAMLQLALLFLIPGSTCIYYGTEVLLEGGQDPDCRRCMPWKEMDAGDYKTELGFMKNLIRLRKTNPALRSMDIHFVYDESFKEDSRILRIIKTDPESGKKIFAAFNFSGEDITLDSDKTNGRLLLSHHAEGLNLRSLGFVFLELE
ncbi:MAG: alpha-glycosidase [Treponema sp.]|nr:alpha-glycosidase [Treponema sp.]